MRSAVQAEAARLGFDVCRVTHAGAPASAEFLDRWLAEGRHGAMAYLARNAAKRRDPNLVLPGIRSVVAVAVSYHHALPGDQAEVGTGPRGVVARYAQHSDYHDVVGPRLKGLAEFIDAQGGEGTRSLWYVDTGPILERDLAQRAGVGFIGKHTNLVGRRLGNWFLLGEILTTAEIEPDEPEKNRCGSCSRCLSACPTQAITAPFELDARRCISYLTIELKEGIPEELRSLVGARVFGCDDCLAACPWNRFAQEGGLMAEVRRGDLSAPDLREWLRLDDAGFRRVFAGTPMLRSKRRGLLRNVCVALGNVGAPDVIPELERVGRDEDAMVAEHARWAIARILERASARVV